MIYRDERMPDESLPNRLYIFHPMDWAICSARFRCRVFKEHRNSVFPIKACCSLGARIRKQ